MKLNTLRPRRLRLNSAVRDMVRENSLSVKDLVYPIFVVAGENVKEEIPSMPDVYHLSVDNAVKVAKEVYELGIPAIEVFGLPEYKDEIGSSAWDLNSPVQRAMRAIKEAVPNLVIVGDVCLCQYTTHGHCGQLCGHEVDNDATLKLLAKVAVSQAQSGADIIAPSDMMDGRIAVIREALDETGFKNVSIMSYAMKEVELDMEEGADFIMVKPALCYLDIVRQVRDKIDRPIAVYNVSGEYSMVKAAAQNGWIDEKRIVMETLLSMKRAGADIIITYHAIDVAKWLKG